MSGFTWRAGFHSPKKVDAEAVKQSLDKLKAPTPENLLDASKRKNHVLHDDLWSEGDQIWAQRGRMERCRHIIGAIQEVVVVGGKEISVRAVEFVRNDGNDRWVFLDAIRSDPELQQAYMAEIQRLQEQAIAKMAKLRELLTT